MSMCNMYGVPCANRKIDLGGRKSWCESKDLQFAAKAADVVGLYMVPPKNAIVLCVDGKPSIQALERAQGYLKLSNGRTLRLQEAAPPQGVSRLSWTTSLLSIPTSGWRSFST